MTGLSSCDNEEFLNVTHYSILEMSTMYESAHPTMDSQATGWDKAFMTQSWNAQTTELSAGWNQAYAAITLSNDFLSGL